MRSFISSLILILVSYSVVTAQPVVRTAAGRVSGLEQDGLIVFKGIPFAEPPLGPLRWKAPQPPKAWNDIRVCTSFSASPMQSNPVPFGVYTPEFLIPAKPISEDCLYLNVWAPRDGRKRPVLVWIYGGGFVSGGSACDIYDGAELARQGIVVVSPNYRVGLFGFFAHPELSRESGRSGNYGLMDQVAALKWVRDNIAAFGGDPHNVTIAGQSAGSMSVNCLVASPEARGLFHRAIAESGGGFVTGGFRSGSESLQSAEERGRKLLEAKSMDFKTFGDLPADEIQKKFQSWGWAPIVDGKLLVQSIAETFAQGRENKVDLLTGWNEDDGSVMGGPYKPTIYKASVAEKYGPLTDSVLRYYPLDDSLSPARLSRDQTFGVQNFIWAEDMAAKGRKVYVYRFAHKVPATGEFVKYGAFHTAEVPYVFRTLKYMSRPFQQEDELLSRSMSAYWVNFIRSGDPNAKGLVVWLPYKKPDRKIMWFSGGMRLETLPDAAALIALEKFSRR